MHCCVRFTRGHWKPPNSASRGGNKKRSIFPGEALANERSANRHRPALSLHCSIWTSSPAASGSFAHPPSTARPARRQISASIPTTIRSTASNRTVALNVNKWWISPTRSATTTSVRHVHMMRLLMPRRRQFGVRVERWNRALRRCQPRAFRRPPPAWRGSPCSSPHALLRDAYLLASLALKIDPAPRIGPGAHHGQDKTFPAGTRLRRDNPLTPAAACQISRRHRCSGLTPSSSSPTHSTPQRPGAGRPPHRQLSSHWRRLELLRALDAGAGSSARPSTVLARHARLRTRQARRRGAPPVHLARKAGTFPRTQRTCCRPSSRRSRRWA